MNRLLLLAALLVTLLSFVPPAEAQTFPLWGGLRAGGHGVGYRSTIVYDRSRTFIPERNYEGQHNAGERARPLLLQIFYPADVAPDAARMSYQDYLTFKADTPVAAAVIEGFRRRTLSIHEYYQDKYLQNYKTGLYEKLMKTRGAAVRDAPFARGSFPVILYGGGSESGTDENLILWEYLASHGYIVAVVPMMGAGSVSSAADAAGLETQARDMEVLFEQVQKLPQADLTRLAAMGFSYSGQAALLLAMRNPDIKAVVGLDPSFISKNYNPFLKSSPFYNVDNVTAPVLEMHRKDALTVTYDVSDALKYAERYSFEIDGLNHVDFENFALAYTAALPEQAKLNSPVAGREAVYEAMARCVLDFLDLYLKAEQGKSAALKRAPEWKGYPADSITFHYSAALPAPPSYAELSRIIRERGIERGEQLYRQVLKRDPSARVIAEESINHLGYELMGAGKVDEAVRVLRLNVERFPRSANAYDSLADAYGRKGNQPCVASAYRKLLEVLPGDAALDESAKASLRRRATEQLQKSQASGAQATCEPQ